MEGLNKNRNIKLNKLEMTKGTFDDAPKILQDSKEEDVAVVPNTPTPSKRQVDEK